MAVKLPKLGVGRVHNTFAQTEAQFVTKGVSTSLTQYFYFVQALNQRTIKCIRDLLTLPPPDLYQTLKDKFIKMYNLSNFQRARDPHGSAANCW